MVNSILFVVKAQIHIHISSVINLLVTHGTLNDQPWLPIYDGLFICSIHFQPVLLSTLNILVVLLLLLTGAVSHSFIENDASNTDNNYDTWEKVDLMPQAHPSIVNKGALPHDIIFRRPLTALGLNILLKVGVNCIFLLFFRQVIVQFSDYLYDILTLLYSEVFFVGRRGKLIFKFGDSYHTIANNVSYHGMLIDLRDHISIISCILIRMH